MMSWEQLLKSAMKVRDEINDPVAKRPSSQGWALLERSKELVTSIYKVKQADDLR